MPSQAKQRRLPAEKRRELILDAARDSFIRKGYAGATTKDIAEATGVTEAMVYRHFASKQELFEEAVALPLERAVGELAEYQSERRPSAGEHEDAADFVRAESLAFFSDLLVAMREIAPLLGVVLFTDEERGGEYYRERISPIHDRVRAIIVDNLPTWNARDFDADILARVTFGMSWALAVDERFDPDHRRDVEGIADELTRLVFDGIRSRD
jgi:AcrR family transcriptional regulator